MNDETDRAGLGVVLACLLLFYLLRAIFTAADNTK